MPQQLINYLCCCFYTTTFKKYFKKHVSKYKVQQTFLHFDLKKKRFKYKVQQTL